MLGGICAGFSAHTTWLPLVVIHVGQVAVFQADCADGWIQPAYRRRLKLLAHGRCVERLLLGDAIGCSRPAADFADCDLVAAKRTSWGGLAAGATRHSPALLIH